MMIKRDYYLNKLIQRKQNGLIKVITGVRRCGKSFLLNNIFYDYLIESGVKNDHIIRFAFDSADDLQLLGESLIDLEHENRKVDPEKFILYIKNHTLNDGLYYLLLDEVQMLGCFESVLNGYLRNSNMDIYVTGSNAKFLSSDIITEFSGRGDEVHMFPLTFSEFMSVYKGDKYEGLVEYMTYGGIPLVVLRNNFSDKSITLNRLFNEIYLNDIFKRHKIKNKVELEDILNILSNGIGSLTNPEKLMNTFKSIKKSNISSNTIRKYIEYLEDSFLIKSVKRYDIKGKSYINTPNKYYFSDLGLRNSRLNFRQFEKTHIIENIIYNELVMRGYNVDVGIVPIIEQNNNHQSVRKQLEVDFICNLGYKRYYIQSVFSLPTIEKTEQETRPLRKIEDSFKKIIITGDIIQPYYDDNGIFYMSIYDFLLNFDSLEK